MTRTGSTKGVPAEFAAQRLKIAESFLKSSRDAYGLLDEGDAGNPVASLAVSAAIAYADVLSARMDRRISSGAHADALGVLKQALGKDLPRAQETAFGWILRVKDASQYGQKAVTRREIGAVMNDLEAFVLWAREMLDRPA